MYKLCSIKQTSASADSPCLCGLRKKQFYKRLKTTPLSSPTENQVRQVLWNAWGYLRSRLKHDLTFQCILCDFKSAMILWIAWKLLFLLKGFKILQVQGLWLEDICSFRKKKKFEANLAKHKAMWNFQTMHRSMESRRWIPVLLYAGSNKFVKSVSLGKRMQRFSIHGHTCDAINVYPHGLHKQKIANGW